MSNLGPRVKIFRRTCTVQNGLLTAFDLRYTRLNGVLRTEILEYCMMDTVVPDPLLFQKLGWHR